MRIRPVLVLLLLLFSLPAFGQRTQPTRALYALTSAEWDYQMAHNPVWASVLGDRRFNDRWDDLSLAALETDHRHNRQVLKKLNAINRAALPPADRLNYDLLRRQYQEWVDAFQFRWHLLPINHQSGLPEGFKQPPGIQAAEQLAGILRFHTVKDYEDWLARLRSFPAYVEQNTALMREGIKAKMVHPKAVMQRVVPVIAEQAAVTPEGSGFYAPFRSFPASIPQPDQQRLAIAARAAIQDAVLPALKDFHAFLTSEYLPAAPEQVGVWQFPRGAELYAHFVREATTTDLTPDQVHELGLAEVKRIRAEMETVKAQAGFTGSLEEFFKFLRSEPRFYYQDPQQLLTAYRALAKTIDPKLMAVIGTLPRMTYGVEPTPAAVAPHATTGFYYPAAPDGSRPGTYLVNLYKPETRPRWEMVPLTLHEAVPGHHLQVSLAAEQTALPNFRRYGYYMAFGEGWALYCEWLGHEMGLYADPYDHFGQLAYEMWRAVRLVVDTGMHARKWTRQQAIDFFLANSPRQELDVVNEIDRYIATPGQALAYKIGQMKILELRRRAEKELVARFDVRAFHDVVLGAGSLPMDLLEQRVNEWIAARRAKP